MEKRVKEKENMPIFGKSIQFLNKNFGWEKQWKSVFAESKWKTLHRLEDLDTKIKCFPYKLNSQRGIFHQHCFSVVGAGGGYRNKASLEGWTFLDEGVRIWLRVPQTQGLAQAAQSHRWLTGLVVTGQDSRSWLTMSTPKAELRTTQPFTFLSYLTSPLNGGKW